MDLLTTREAAKKLRVTPIRVRQMIREGKIEAKQIGRDYVIEESSLASVKTYSKAGRPAKAAKSDHQENITDKPFKTIFDIAPELVGSIKDGLPTDLSSNKEYLRDLGKKSVEKKVLQVRKKTTTDE
jgi:excisionase family DNA binding protein